MLTRKLIIAATLIATTAASTFAGWTQERTVKEVGVSPSGDYLYAYLNNETAYHNGTQDKLFIMKRGVNGVSDVEFQMLHSQLMTAVEKDKTVKISYGSKYNLWNQPAYNVNSINLQR